MKYSILALHNPPLHKTEILRVSNILKRQPAKEWSRIATGGLEISGPELCWVRKQSEDGVGISQEP